MAANLILAVASLLIFLLGTEGLLRLFDPDLFYQGQEFLFNRDTAFPNFYKRDQRLFWRFRNGQTIDSRQFSFLSYTINSRGIRGPEIESAGDRTRILSVGNSCTFGWAVKFEEIYSAQLQKLLNERAGASRYQVLNGGVPGYSSFQGKRYLEELLEYNPSVVTIMFGWNDHFPAGHKIRDSQQELPPSIVISMQNAFSKLKLYQLLRKLILPVVESKPGVRLDDPSSIPRVTRQELSENLNQMIELLRQNSAEPVLLIPPLADLDIYGLGTRSPFHKRHEGYQAEIRKVAILSGVHYIDLQPIFDTRNDLFNNAFDDPIHFNARGHALLASTLADSLSLWFFRN
jgi:lysophospholipase L1-like esterase